MAGQVVEIRTVDLRCSVDEAAEVVASSMGLDIADQVVAEIHQKTMGWLAGIRLAAQTVAASPDTARSAAQLPAVSAIDGAYDAIGDYLIEEVLDDLSDDDRRFLLDTSILEHLVRAAVRRRHRPHGQPHRPGAASPVAGCSPPGSMLSGGDWYRYHDLFRTTAGHPVAPHHPRPGAATPPPSSHLALRPRRRRLRHRPCHRRATTPPSPPNGSSTAPARCSGETSPQRCARSTAESTLSWTNADPIFLATWCFPVLYCEEGIPDIDPVLNAAVDRCTGDE